MRILLLAFTLVSISAAPGGAATRNFGITSFEKIRVDGPFKVTLKTGIAPYARANGSPSALDHVAIDVRGNTLVVHNSMDSWSGSGGDDSGSVEISLGTHDLSSAWLNGSGTLSIDKVKGLSFDLSVQGSGAADIGTVAVDQFSTSVAGAASARLGGRAAKLTAIVRGISSLDASGLVTKDATVAGEGAATIKANVINAVTVDASGPATIAFDGKPSCTLRLHGSATVSGCRSSQ